MRRLIALTFLAVILVIGCIRGAIWQYDRYEVRHAGNELIKKNAHISPISAGDLPRSEKELESFAWRPVVSEGRFVPEKEFLIRNRYHEGKYGYGVMTLFLSTSGERFWVDRGWVKAGPDAKTPPIIKPVTNQEIFIEGRLRIESVENDVGGSLFAIPSRGGGSQLTEWNNKNAIKTQPYYLVMTDAKPESFAPDFPTPLPELSDGPHLAYAFQWMLFAGLVLFALYLVLREDRRAQRAKD